MGGCGSVGTPSCTIIVCGTTTRLIRSRQFLQQALPSALLSLRDSRHTTYDPEMVMGVSGVVLVFDRSHADRLNGIRICQDLGSGDSHWFITLSSNKK